MEDRTVPCSVLLIGENPSDTSVLQHALDEVRPDAPVTVARHQQDAARSLAICGVSGFRAVFLVPQSLDDAEILTLVRSGPGGGATRLVVLLRDEFVHQTRSFYLRGAHSVLPWPADPIERDRIARNAMAYWEDLNIPSVSTPVVAIPQASVL